MRCRHPSAIRGMPHRSRRRREGRDTLFVAALVLPRLRLRREKTGRISMRVPFVVLTLFATVAASSAWAQQPQAGATPFMSDKDIMALVEKAKADRKGDAPIVAEPILQLAPYKAQLEYRPGTGPAAYHEHDAELMV